MPANHCSRSGTAFNQGLPFFAGSSSITIYVGTSSAPDTPSSAYSPAPPLEPQGPMYLRISRMKVPQLLDENYQFKLGKAVLLKEGSDITLMANGVLAGRALKAARLLAARGVSARVLNMSTVKPLDREVVLDAARTTRGIVTAEEAMSAGGLGSAVAELLAEEHPAPMRILGVKDVFAPTGTEEFLLDHFGLNAAGIERAVLDLLKKVG